jgi:hypothetical protein
MEGPKHFQIKDYSKGVGSGMRQFEMHPLRSLPTLCLMIVLVQKVNDFIRVVGGDPSASLRTPTTFILKLLYRYCNVYG